MQRTAHRTSETTPILERGFVPEYARKARVDEAAAADREAIPHVQTCLRNGATEAP